MATSQDDVHTGTAPVPHLKRICGVNYCGRAEGDRQARVDVGTPEEWAPTLTEIRANGYPATANALELFVNRDEALRELLSYCRDKAENDDTWPDNIGRAYEDVADRLAKILDGES